MHIIDHLATFLHSVMIYIYIMLISTACTRISIHTIIQCAGLYISRENDYHLWVRHKEVFVGILKIRYVCVVGFDLVTPILATFIPLASQV